MPVTSQHTAIHGHTLQYMATRCNAPETHAVQETWHRQPQTHCGVLIPTSVCVCVCVCVCACACVSERASERRREIGCVWCAYTCVHKLTYITHMQTNMHVNTHMKMHAYTIQVFMHACIHAYICACIHAYIYACIHARCIHTCMQYICLYAHAHQHAHAHAHTPSCKHKPMRASWLHVYAQRKVTNKHCIDLFVGHYNM